MKYRDYLSYIDNCEYSKLHKVKELLESDYQYKKINKKEYKIFTKRLEKRWNPDSWIWVIKESIKSSLR